MVKADFDDAIKIELIRRFKQLSRQKQNTLLRGFLGAQASEGWRTGTTRSEIEQSNDFIGYLERLFGIRGGNFQTNIDILPFSNNKILNINQQNMIWTGGGLLAFMISDKLGPIKSIAKLGGLAAAAIGVADIMGIFSINQLPIPKFGGYGAWERPHGSYNVVSLNQLPYDPNNYYLPPRTT